MFTCVFHLRIFQALFFHLMRGDENLLFVMNFTAPRDNIETKQRNFVILQSECSKIEKNLQKIHNIIINCVQMQHQNNI